MVKMLVSTLLLAAAVAPAHAASPSVAKFYQNKDLRMVLSAGPGGGYAAYAQTFAPFLRKYIPGKPKIIIQNMVGGGGLRAMQYFAHVAPRDGGVIGLVHSSVPFAPLYGVQGANFDPRKMHWIGSINATKAMCVSWTASGVTKWRDLFKGKFVVGSTGAGSQMQTMPAMINKLFGTNIKIISGYTGGNNVYLAMQRGEVNGRCGALVSSIQATRPDWFSKKKVTVVVAVGMKRNPMFPAAPALGEFVKNARTRKILKLILLPLEMDRPILTPPGVPAKRVDALRKAFHQAVNDPQFLAAAKRERLEVKEVSGKQVKAIIDEAFDLPPDIAHAARDAMNLTGTTSKK